MRKRASLWLSRSVRKRMEYLRQEWEDHRPGISKPLTIRIGINTGYCNVGNFGSEDRLDYTIIGGEPVIELSLASLEGVERFITTA